MAEAFVHPLRRDCFDELVLPTGPNILREPGRLQRSYNTEAPRLGALDAGPDRVPPGIR